MRKKTFGKDLPDMLDALLHCLYSLTHTPLEIYIDQKIYFYGW